MDKVAIYCRLSEEDRDKLNKTDDSESIKNQKSMLLKYAMQQGWEVYNIYSDDDYAGADRKRPEFNRLLHDAEEGKFDIVLCKLSRVSLVNLSLLKSTYTDCFLFGESDLSGLLTMLILTTKVTKKQGR